MGKIITAILLSPIVFFAAILLASEYGGEVVTLETHDERGGKYETSVWIVDLYGDQWLRAGDSEATWLKRIRDYPEVHVTRFGEREVYRAEVDDDFSGRINDGMREKYGRADQLISTIHDDEEVVAIRLIRPEES
jgi:hypothetical protein